MGQPASAGTSGSESEDFVGAKFYCPRTLADGNNNHQLTTTTTTTTV